MKSCIHTLLTLFFAVSIGYGQRAVPGQEWEQDGSAPSVFLIGQNETSYEKLMTDHGTMLLSVCDNDMNEAYGKWVDVLIQMEAYSKEVNFDLNGVKLWINIFWNMDGSIKHIVYHPKPNSRNLKTEDLSTFFISFIDQYETNIESSYKFSHYGSAAFPTFPQRVKR